MRTWEQGIIDVARHFEAFFPEIFETKHLGVFTVVDVRWGDKERASVQPDNWRGLKGVYVFVDEEDDGIDHPAVIRLFGDTKDRNGFYSRLKGGYRCLSTEHEPFVSYKDKKTGDWVKWFRYRWIAVIPMDDKAVFLRTALQYFLIARIHTTHNTTGINPNTEPRRFIGETNAKSGQVQN